MNTRKYVAWYEWFRWVSMWMLMVIAFTFFLMVANYTGEYWGTSHYYITPCFFQAIFVECGIWLAALIGWGIASDWNL